MGKVVATLASGTSTDPLTGLIEVCEEASVVPAAKGGIQAGDGDESDGSGRAFAAFHVWQFGRTERLPRWVEKGGVEREGRAGEAGGVVATS